MLPRHQPNPSRQVASGREGCPIAYLGDQSGGDNRADAGYSLEPPALLARTMPSVDVLLDSSDLYCDGFILTSKNGETEPCDRWKPIVSIVANYLDQLCGALAALSRDDAELRHMAPDRIRQHLALPDQKLPTAMQH